MTRWLLFIVIMWHCGKVFALWEGSGVGGEISRKALVIKSALSDMLYLSDVLHGSHLSCLKPRVHFSWARKMRKCFKPFKTFLCIIRCVNAFYNMTRI